MRVKSRSARTIAAIYANIQCFFLIRNFCWGNQSPKMHFIILIDFILSSKTKEPIGTVKPNVNIGDKTNIANIRYHHKISLLCPVQSYPIPAFRYLRIVDLLSIVRRFYFHPKFHEFTNELSSCEIFCRSNGKSKVFI